MKKFNIATNGNPLVLGRKLPHNCVYGNFNGLYYYVTDFTTYRHETHIQRNVTYDGIFRSVTNVTTTSRTKYPYIALYVYDRKADKWRHTRTDKLQNGKALFDFITPLFKRCGCRNENVQPYIPNNVKPHEKHAQVTGDSVFRANVGYALSSRISTDTDAVRGKGGGFRPAPYERAGHRPTYGNTLHMH